MRETLHTLLNAYLTAQAIGLVPDDIFLVVPGSDRYDEFWTAIDEWRHPHGIELHIMPKEHSPRGLVYKLKLHGKVVATLFHHHVAQRYHDRDIDVNRNPGGEIQ